MRNEAAEDMRGEEELRIGLGVGVEVVSSPLFPSAAVRITQGQITRVLGVLTTHHDAQPAHMQLKRHFHCAFCTLVMLQVAEALYRVL